MTCPNCSRPSTNGECLSCLRGENDDVAIEWRGILREIRATLAALPAGTLSDDSARLAWLKKELDREVSPAQRKFFPDGTPWEHAIEAVWSRCMGGRDPLSAVDLVLAEGP